MRAPRGGIETYWQVFEGGPRPALFIHCGMAHSGAWRGVAEALSDLATVTAFDMAGHGRSGPVPGGALPHDVVTAQGASFLERPMDVVGHSFGGTVALRLAMEHPDKVRTLGLVEPVLFAAAREVRPEAFDAHVAEITPFAEAADAGDWEGAARAFDAVWGDGTPWEDLPERQRAHFTRSIHTIRVSDGTLFEDLKGLLAPGRLEALLMPVALIEGARSPGIVSAVHDAFAARIPEAARVSVPGAGHMLPITHPAEVAAALRGLFSRG